MSARLPLRVEPLPGEWWRGYVRRVASVFDSTALRLLRQVDQGKHITERQELWSGITVSPDRADKLGSFFKLHSDQVMEMHLATYDGSALHLDDVHGSGGRPASKEAEALRRARRYGRLVSPGVDRFCLQCDQESPGYRATNWRLQYQLICTRHWAVLQPEDWTGQLPTVTTKAVSAQKEILARLSPSPVNRHFFALLQLQLTRGSVFPKAAWHRILDGSAEEILEKFCSAVDRTINHGYPVYQRMSGWAPEVAGQHLRAPEMLSVSASSNLFPHLLPMHLFSPQFLDVLSHMPLRRARAITAVGARMLGTGCVLAEATGALAKRWRKPTIHIFIDELVRMEKQGQADLFWRLCRVAAAALTQEKVDYRAREAVMSDSRAINNALKDAGLGHLRLANSNWIIDKWACTIVLGRMILETQDGSEPDERQFGYQARAALDQLLNEF